MTAKENFISEIEKLLKTNTINEDAMNYFTEFKNGTVKNSSVITEKGAAVLRFLQTQPSTNYAFTAKMIAEELNMNTRSISGTMRKLLNDGYVEKLRGRAKDLGVADMIQFVGGVYGDKKWKLYGEASLFVLPTHSENFGIVVAEALACGIPVITTKGTPWEDLVTSHCGWWTGIGTQPTVEALKDFLNKTDTELSEMGENGRKLVRERYSSSAIARQFLKMYSQL